MLSYDPIEYSCLAKEKHTITNMKKNVRIKKIVSPASQMNGHRSIDLKWSERDEAKYMKGLRGVTILS